MLSPLFENMFIKTSDVHNYPIRQADLLYVQYAASKEHKELWNIMEQNYGILCIM